MRRTLRNAGYIERQHAMDGVVLNYAEGPDHGPPLVLFPGQTQPWQSYTRVLPALAREFHVFAVDIHGHGKSSFCPDRYRFAAIGRDFARFLEEVVGKPAILSGNSSGGVIAVWLAAHAPELVAGIVPEDPPLFSCEWPRLKECFVHGLLELAVERLADRRDVPGFFRRFEIPVEGDGKVSAAAGPALKVVAGYVRLIQALHPERREVWLPGLPFVLQMVVAGFSGYDAEFSRPFLDGSFGAGFDHAEALARISCPVLLLHAHWFVSDRHGLVGAMTDEDVERIRSLVRNIHVEEIASGHIVHQENPGKFVHLLNDFARQL